MDMGKIIATTFGAVLLFYGLGAFASPGVMGMHSSPVGNLVNLVLGAVVLAAAQRAGPSLSFWACAGVGALYLAWGLAGFALGRPGESSLNAMLPDRHLLVLAPGYLEAGRNDHILHLFFGLGLGIASVAGVAETPFRLRRRS
jgi:hypothetical protein